MGIPFGTYLLARESDNVVVNRSVPIIVVPGDVAPTTPDHGHVLCGSAELHRPEYTWDDAMTGTSELETAETIRVAFVALGSAHAVRITLHVGSLAEPQIKGLWRQALERLYVTCPRDRGAAVGCEGAGRE